MIFKVKTRFYDENSNQKGDTVLVRREIPIEDIKSVEEVYNGSRILKSRCMLICNPPINNMIVEQSFDKTMTVIKKEKDRGLFQVKGFKRYDS